MAQYVVYGIRGKTMSVFEIWYMRREWFADGIMGEQPNKNDLSKTHILLKTLATEGWTLANVFVEMQADNWSPNGEGRGLIEAKGLGHTSMSVGDVIVEDGEAYVVQGVGFRKL
jgi:hypothetical protein